MAGSAGAIKAGRAYVEFFTDTSKFSAGLGTVSNRLNKISSSIAMTGGKLTALGAAGVAGLMPAINAASDLQESLNVFGTVFKDNTGAMRDWTAATAQALGRSESQIIQFTSKTGAQLQGMGFDTGQSSEMSKALSALAVDLASFYNTADADALDAIMSAFRGEADPIERFNVNVKEAAVNQKLLQSSIDPSKATESQKAYARYALILEQTTMAQGDAVKTSGSYSNQLKRLQATALTLGETIGGALLDSLSSFYGTVSNVAVTLQKWIQANPALIKSVAMVAVGVAALGGALVALGAFGAAAAIAIKILVAPFALISTAVGLLVPLLSALLSPIGLVVAAIAILSGAFIKKIGGLQPIFDWFKAKFDEIVGVATRAVKAIMGALERGDFGAAIEVAMAGMSVALQAALQPIRTAWANFTGYFKEAFAKAAYALPVIMVGVSAMIQKAWLKTTEALKSALVKNVNDVAKKESTAAFDKMEARFKELRDSGQMSEGDFKSRMEALNKARAADMTEAEKIAAKDQADIDKNRADAISKINSDAKAELDSLKAQMDADVAAVRGQTDGAAAEAQSKLDAAKKRLQDALQAAEAGNAAAGGGPEAGPAPDGPKANLEDIKNQMDALGGGADATQEAKQKATAGPIVGGERAGQIFGTVSLEEISREQLKVQKEQLRAFDKTATYLRNVANQMSLEFQ